MGQHCTCSTPAAQQRIGEPASSGHPQGSGTLFHVFGRPHIRTAMQHGTVATWWHRSDGSLRGGSREVHRRRAHYPQPHACAYHPRVIVGRIPQITMSRLFMWYGRDFGADEEATLRALSTYLNDERR